jgi:hypothetical protein
MKNSKQKYPGNKVYFVGALGKGKYKVCSQSKYSPRYVGLKFGTIKEAEDHIKNIKKGESTENKTKKVMKKQTITKGYKVTNSEMKCRDYQFKLGKKYEETGTLSICNNGFHFCQEANDCFNYYDFDPKNRVFEIEAYGEVSTNGDKSCCLKIKLIREIPWEEVLRIVNTGKENTGRGNSGYRNSGDRNSGDSNSGDSNSGDSNSGDRNSGNWNSGDSNSGDRNSGNWNSGDRNSGYRNSGYRNSGDSNSGYRNSGNWNSGDRNSGYRNSGYRNSGYRNSGDSNSGDSNSGYSNSGDSNSGDSNSGNWNSGDRNSGDSNSGYRNSGAFCTDSNPVLYLFNKPSTISVREWERSKAVELMNSIDPTVWIPWSMMSEDEKKSNPKYEASEGYCKSIPIKDAWRNAWDNWNDETKRVFTSLENFDTKIFEEITGIKLY